MGCGIEATVALRSQLFCKAGRCTEWFKQEHRLALDGWNRLGATDQS